MIDFSRTIFWHDPYPIGIISISLDPSLYAEMVSAFPSQRLFKHMQGHYDKFSLSEVNNPEQYHSFIKSSHLWSRFHAYIKSDQFTLGVERALKINGVEPLSLSKCRSRFEFSSLSPVGGRLDAHTDIPSKIVTIVMSMVNPGEWNTKWGGGTDVLLPNKDKQYKDYAMHLSDFDVVRTIEYIPNQCVIFIKTINSWHSVGPISGPEGAPMRKTLTINIEKSK